MPADEIADILIRATRGEDVPAAELTSAQLSVEALDDSAVLVVVGRLRDAGLLDQVVERGVLEADEEQALLNRIDAEVRVTTLATPGFSEAEAAAQIAWAEQTYAAHGITLIVETHGPMDEDEFRGILALDGNANQADFSRGNRDAPPPPGMEVEALLAAAWQYGPSASAHVVFLAAALPGADGATFQPGLYQTSQPGALVAAGSRTSVFGHEIGHLLGLGHIEDEHGTEQESDNVMATLPPRGGRLTPDQVNRVKGSVLARLVPRSTDSRPDVPVVGELPGVMPQPH